MPLLSHLVVLDLSDTIAGQFAARIMADYGAWVGLVEAPSGSPMRKCPPFWNDGDNESILFWHLNSGKNSIVLDKGDPAEWNRLVELCRNADVVIVADLELAKRLESECSQSVIGLVTDFGDCGPYSSWTGCELVHQALSGSMYVGGLPGREPLYGIGERASYAAGLWLYVSVLAALYGRKAHGESYGVCEVTLHEAAAAMEENFSLRWAYSHHVVKRGGDSSRAVCSLDCKDGWAILFVRSLSGQWRALCDVLNATELAEDPRFASWGNLTRNWSNASKELNQRSSNWLVEDLVNACAPAGLVIAKVENGDSLRVDRHLNERKFWQSVPIRSGIRPSLGPLFSVPSHPANRNRPSPGIGEGEPMPAYPFRAGYEACKRSATARPLRNISVLEMTTAWAGPMSTRILALLGARVIKVEGPQWLDSWRGPRSPERFEQYPDGDPGPHPYNRCVRFNAQNLGKLDILLDLKSDEGRKELQRIAHKMDAVVANLRPGALKRLGLDFETVSQVTPGISIIEMSVVGNGPDQNRIGLGPTMEAMAGIANLIGYEDSGPLGSGSSYMDPMGALHGAAAAISVLYARLDSGSGAFAEIAQREAAMTWIGEILLGPTSYPSRCANAVRHAAPHDAFRTEGDDEWIAIAVFDEVQWASLCAVLAMNDLIQDERFATLQARHSNAVDLYAILSEAIRAYDKVELSELLQREGVPAAPVLTGRDLFSDPHLRVRGWFARLSHAEAGIHDYAGLPVSFGGNRCQPTAASPSLGEHTASILSKDASLNEEHDAPLER
jgi:crotonobetainyl-CoA:carnitine CoA-transferase CaiB-like acyl-CoA transferase